MDWSTYYERFYGWADSTQVSRISSIDEFGDVSDEVAEIVQNLYNDKAATRLVRRALQHGVRFTASEITEMIFDLDTVPDELLLTCKTAFTQDQIDSISFSYHNTEILNEISRKSGLQRNLNIHIDTIETDVRIIRTNKSHIHQKATLGQLLSAIASGIFSGLFTSKDRKHNGRCNGDCANCPPHFGYRYGRWYYGHGHNYGCQFGGNRGGGSKQ